MTMNEFEIMKKYDIHNKWKVRVFNCFYNILYIEDHDEFNLYMKDNLIPKCHLKILLNKMNKRTFKVNK